MDIWHLMAVLRKRTAIFIGIFLLLASALVVTLLIIKPVYQATAKLIAMNEDYICLNDPGIKLLLPRSQILDAQIKMIKDNAVLNEVIRELDIRDKGGDLITSARLSDKLKVQSLEDTDIIKIRVEDPDPAEAAKIANSTARQFVKWTLKINRLQKETLARYLDDSFKLIKYRQFVLSKRMAELKKKKALMQVNEEVHKEISKQVELEIEKAKINILLKEEQLKLFITENADIAATLKARSAFLERGIENFSQAVKGLSSSESESALVLREEKVVNSLNSMLFQKMSDLKLSEALKQGGARVVSYAGTASAPASYKRGTAVIAGLIMVLVISAGFTLLTEYADHTIKTGEEARHLLGLRIIGEIPQKKVGMLADASGEDVPKEVLSNRTIIVASLLPDNLKQYISVSLAKSASKQGKNTLLIDADSGSPVLDRVFACKSAPGLGEVLSGGGISSSIYSAGINNLSIMPAGKAPEQGEDLFSQEKMRDLLAKLEEKFDSIIVNAPAAGASGPGMHLYRFCRACIIVMSEGTITKEEAQEAIGMIRTAGAKIEGAVFSHA